MSKHLAWTLMVAVLLTIASIGSATAAAGYAPRQGDSFTFRETIAVSNGQGSYTGYTDQSSVAGTEMMNSVIGGNVSTHYGNTYSFSNNQGSSYTNSSSGDFTWSTSNYQYVNGTDNQVGYAKPVYVWFAMDPSLPVGGTFYSLNTQLSLQSKNISFLLQGNGSRWVQAIWARGSGQYQRHDSYGTFTASYTWDEYFDPTTGYIVGYHYVEQDNGQYQGQAGSFTYTDDLYVVNTSYALATASPSTSTELTTGTGNTSGPEVDLGLLAIAVLAMFVLILIVAVVVTRRGKKGNLPEHSPPPAAPAPTQWQSNVNLGSRPPEQVVIRDVAKVACRYCGTMIPTTADTCPYCGGPRR